MSALAESSAWGLAVGASLVAGAVAAAATRLPNRVAALLTCFGGGLLLSAVALELVPEADARTSTTLTALGLTAGALIYVAADHLLGRDPQRDKLRRMGHMAAAGREMEVPANAEVKRGESIAVGLFIDGVPESVALGLTVAEGKIGVALLAGVLVGNVVEAYGASQPIIEGGNSKRFAIGLMAGIGLILALATLIGGTVLSEASGDVIGGAQAIAAGAVLAVLTTAVIPHAFAEANRAVALATVLGFVGGYALS